MDPRGLLIVKARGQDWRLWLGMSVLADVQSTHGADWLARLQPPAGQADGAPWMPPMQIVIDLLIGALQRYHRADADRWLADDILADNPNVLAELIQAAFPDQTGNGRAATGPTGGNGRARAKAA
jgi:hypothetical protein